MKAVPILTPQSAGGGIFVCRWPPVERADLVSGRSTLPCVQRVPTRPGLEIFQFLQAFSGLPVPPFRYLPARKCIRERDR
jgi:hypothetical protein